MYLSLFIFFIVLSGTILAAVLLSILPACIAHGPAIVPEEPDCVYGPQYNTSFVPVSEPIFQQTISQSIDTGWFSSPIIFDLDNDNSPELIIATYRIAVFNNNYELLDIDNHPSSSDRVYACHAVADLDNDGIYEIIAGRGNTIVVFEWKNKQLQMKSGFPVEVDSDCEIRGLALGDLDGDGWLEIITSNTAGNSGSQVYVHNAKGEIFQPCLDDQHSHKPAWPRYNFLHGEGNDADRNCQGHGGYGAYGFNVAVGNVDNDNDLEVICTYDNHHIQVFKPDGIAIDVGEYYTNPSTECLGSRFTYGQFIRWCDPDVEHNHYHLHLGPWPSLDQDEWLQWTASPPIVADIDNDNRNEIIGIPNVEKFEPYVTQAYAVMVLEGAHNSSAAGTRKTGFNTLPRGGSPLILSGYYPPLANPAPIVVRNSNNKDIIVSLNDGYIYCFSYLGVQRWRYNYMHGKSIMYASEVTAVDLNQDSIPEIIFSTYGDPDVLDSGYLTILDFDGNLLFDIPLQNTGQQNGNGNGAPAAPTVGDFFGDNSLAIAVQTFEHGIDIYKVPGATTNCMYWYTSRGSRLRMGQPTRS